MDWGEGGHDVGAFPRDRRAMTTPRIIPCQSRCCKHFWGIAGPPNDPVFICAAFPTGIPANVLSGRSKHARPIEGDGGIQYESAANGAESENG